MKGFHPSPALVISLIALFVALGGTSYAAISSLPANSVGTQQLKNGAVTAAKLAYGQTLPSGKTETGAWGYGNYAGASDGGGSQGWATATFTNPLAARLDGSHTIYVTAAPVAHCAGAGSADRGYLCVYQGDVYHTTVPISANIFSAEGSSAALGTGKYGWTIYLRATAAGESWLAAGTYAVTAP
jgi:hypothetical protein